MSGIITAGVVVAGAGVAYAAHESAKAQASVANNRRDPASEVPLLTQLFPDVADQARMQDFLSGKQQLQLDQDAAYSDLKLYPQFAESERKATSAQRTDDLRDLRRLGTGIMGELFKANPGFGASLTALNNRVGLAGQPTALLSHLNDEALTAGPSELRTLLSGTALDNLRLGGKLSAEDERLAQQTARGAWADRGLGASDPALIDEVLNRDSVSRQRLAERQAAAQAAVSTGIQEDASNRDFGVGVEGLNQRNRAADDALLTNAVAVNQNALEPMLSFLRPRAAVGPGVPAAIMASGPQSMGASNGLLAQLLGYGQDANDSNFNAIESRANARANNAAAIGGAAVGAGTSFVSSGLKYRASMNQGG